jgi:hypothetical protein
MDPVDIFRKNIERLIRQRGLVQSHVAAAIDETPQKLNNYLKGRINWGEQKRLKLSNFLKVDYHSLYNKEFTAGATAGIGFGATAGYEIIRKQPRTNPDAPAEKNEPSNDAETPAQPDPDLLAQVIEGVEDYLHDNKRALEPKLKAQLVSLLYEYFAKTGEKVDKKKVESYLKLVA